MGWSDEVHRARLHSPYGHRIAPRSRVSKQLQPASSGVGLAPLLLGCTAVLLRQQRVIEWLRSVHDRVRSLKAYPTPTQRAGQAALSRQQASGSGRPGPSSAPAAAPATGSRPLGQPNKQGPKGKNKKKRGGRR
ncbi:hypothetical protein ACKKBF_B20405 [Auxenochlorella protothecoides x Auxenochlorella symbiontica]